jgi:hypothetical protein
MFGALVMAVRDKNRRVDTRVGLIASVVYNVLTGSKTEPSTWFPWIANDDGGPEQADEADDESMISKLTEIFGDPDNG